VLQAIPGTVHSGSYETRHGFIHASALASIPSSAEMAVHESAHQYFLLISRLGPVEDGTDGTLYYSPLVEKKRPLNRILFAFHACANIFAFYRLCQAAGSPHQEYFSRNENVVLDQMKQLGAPLLGNPALTSLGRSLLEPWQGVIS
jgi:HEXXH motif-containing protein